MLMEQVNYHLDLVEKDYFGLQYTDPYNVPHWLDPSKVVKKQVKSEYRYGTINGSRKIVRKCRSEQFPDRDKFRIVSFPCNVN